jgi:hypothetical protein
MNAEIDVRPILPTIRVPTLVLHRTEDLIPVEGARWTASQIPGARFVELPGGPHFPYYGDWESVVNAIREFVVPIATQREAPERESVLATVLFTDLVGSTAKAAELGDRRWRDLLEQHHTRIRQQLSEFRGLELDTAGDGFFARFDGPVRSAAPRRSARPSASSGSTCARVCTPGSARCSTAKSRESRSPSARASQRGPRRARCSSRRR